MEIEALRRLYQKKGKDFFVNKSPLATYPKLDGLLYSNGIVNNLVFRIIFNEVAA